MVKAVAGLYLGASRAQDIAYFTALRYLSLNLYLYTLSVKADNAILNRFAEHQHELFSGEQACLLFNWCTE